MLFRALIVNLGYLCLNNAFANMSNVSTGSLFSLLASEKDEIFACYVRLLVCLFSCC